MSAYLSLLGGTGLDALFRMQRRIGFIIPHVTVLESGHDELVITDHPVQQGASISDHAYKRPAEVKMLVGWSNSHLLALTSGLIEDFCKRVYEDLLDLQVSREPFTLVTGKRSYPNMLIASITKDDDRHTEYALKCSILFRQVIITKVRYTSSTPVENQAQPESTAEAVDSGVRQPDEISDEGIQVDGRSLGVIRALDNIRSAQGLPTVGFVE